MTGLEGLGWGPLLETAFAPFRAEGWEPARVTIQHSRLYTVQTDAGETLAEVSGRFRHEAAEPSDFPVTGDWVAIHPPAGEGTATIHAVLPRRSGFIRKAPGDAARGQLVAANVDTVFLVMGLDGDYNPRRLERYLSLAWESGADPVVLLTKPDLCPEAPERKRALEGLGAPVHVVSPKYGHGLDALTSYLSPGRTVALLGSSGVGKSTLVNSLLGEDRFETREVREKDDRGRHTTVRRELVVLPGGGLVIDTPGLRELGLWESAELEAVFTDVRAVAAGCRFSDCRHEGEPDCAVNRAVAEGVLDHARLESYHKLQREMRNLKVRHDPRARLGQKRKWKSIHKAARHHKPRG